MVPWPSLLPCLSSGRLARGLCPSGPCVQGSSWSCAALRRGQSVRRTGEGSARFHWAAPTLQAGTWRLPGQCCLFCGGGAVGSLTVPGTVHPPELRLGGRPWSWSRPPAWPLPREKRTCVLGCPGGHMGPSAQGVREAGLGPQHSGPGGSEFPMGEVCNPEWDSWWAFRFALPEPLCGLAQDPGVGEAWWELGTVRSCGALGSRVCHQPGGKLLPGLGLALTGSRVGLARQRPCQAGT